ncbi:MAG: response regulator [Polyangiales bacterium]
MTRTLPPPEILLVEDSPTDRLMAVEALREAKIPHHLSSVDNGVDALAFLRREGAYADAPWPDLVLLDLNLPRKDGREVLAEMKHDPVLKFIPVVVLTTSGAEEDVISSYGNQASSFIRKPIDYDEFARSVRALGDYWADVVTLPTEDAIRRSARPRDPVVSLQPRPTNALRVLLLEDSPSDDLIVRDSLRGSAFARFEVTTVPSLSSLRTRDDLGTYDVVITDLGLPDGQGMETLRQVRQTVPEKPVIVLTVLDDEELGLQAVREGAQDYVIKQEMTPGGLIRAIRYSVDKHRNETRLRETQRLEAVGQLAAGVAQDFNNLLTAILGQAHLIGLSAELSPEARNGLDEINLAAERAATLTRRLLTFSRQQVFRPRAIDVGAALGAMSRMLPRLLGKEIALEIRRSAEPTPADADPGMLEELIINLVLNARDAMPHGGSLSLSTRVVDVGPGEVVMDATPGRFVRISVRDTGEGIPTAMIPRIFEPFFTTKELGRGAGLGLASVHGIVRQHRGMIRVQSERGQGTRFDVDLPVSVERPRALAPRKPVVVGGGETILVVDDEAPVRRTLVRFLTRAGYVVLSAESGPDALACWEKHDGKIDLLFTDLVMPGGMGGQELAAALTARRSALKVVFTSGYSTAFVSDAAALEEGVNFLLKPYALTELTRVLRDRLDG